MSDGAVNSSALSIQGSSLGGQLLNILMADSILPGADVSYELAKVIYLYHPLGQKMAEAPIALAQSQARKITVQGSPDEVPKAFRDEWLRCNADGHIANVHRLSRVYGLSAIIIGCEQVKPGEPLDMTKIWNQDLYFNVLDPLNTAGSLVLSQIPNAPDFNKPVSVRVNGEVFHRSRYQVVMNEVPVYLAYTGSAFGFVGRSVYQRALYPLKSFIRTMIADDMIATKLGLIVAKQKPPGGIITGLMERIAHIKRQMLKDAQTGQVLSVDKDEDVTTLDMQNVDGAGKYSRDNILRNAATAAEMPAKILENETMIGGMAEGTEDAKVIANYVGRFRMQMEAQYRWFDSFVQYRAWNPEFYAVVQRKYPDTYGGKSFEEAFSDWRHAFAAEWPSFLIEPESEQIKVEQTKNESIVAVAQTLLPELDPANKARVIQWLADNIGENKMLFPHDLDLDYEELEDFLGEQKDQEDEQAEAMAEGARLGLTAGTPGGEKGSGKDKKGGGTGKVKPPGNNGAKQPGGMASKFGKFA